MSHAEPTYQLRAVDVSIPASHAWRKIPTVALIVAAVGALASVGIGLGGHALRQLYSSYLVAFLYFLSFALGGLFFTVVQFAARAGWSVVVRRIAETFMATLPVFVPLFIPLIVGMHDLYHWTHHDVVAHDVMLKHKASYLNVPFFLIRAVLFLGAWTLLSRFYYSRSIAQDKSGDVQLTRSMQNLSGPALIIFAFTLTYASLDWIMSLEPHWYSTIYGVYYFAGSLVAIFSGMCLVGLAVTGAGFVRNPSSHGGRDLINAEHFHDLGKLLFAFLVFWTYIAFSQYMLIWYSNQPEETVWFTLRWGGGWEYVTVLLAVGHFGVPFFFLMSRHIKRSRPALAVAACWMLVVHYIDLYWLVMPTLHPKDLHVSPLDLTTLVAVGGVFVFAFSRFLLSHPLIPIGDPRLPESIAFENA